jgi:hypothetical protein
MELIRSTAAVAVLTVLAVQVAGQLRARTALAA